MPIQPRMLWVLLAVQIAASQDSSIDNLIRSLKDQYAPDPRTAVFNVTCKQEQGSFIVAGEVESAAAKNDLLEQLRYIAHDRTVDRIVALPEPALGDKTFGLVRVSVANMCRRPDHASELVSQAIMGTVVQVLRTGGGWLYGRTPDRYLGWIERDSLVPASKQSIDDWNTARKAIVTDLYGFVRARAEEKSESVSDVVIGSTLRYLDRKGRWMRVRFPDGREGYIQSATASDFGEWIRKRRLSAYNIVNTARRFNGLPYLWGETSAKGFDCSGFSKTVYWLNGVDLPRDADQQAALGREINPGTAFENLKSGDLLFFGRRGENGKPDRITHVGIYLGNQEFIHCATLIGINSLDPKAANFNEYRRNTLLRVRRLMKE